MPPLAVVVAAVSVAVAATVAAAEDLRVCVVDEPGFTARLDGSSVSAGTVFTASNRSHLTGFDVELRESVLAHLGVDYHMVFYSSYAAALDGVRTGACQLASAPFTKTASREACDAACTPPAGSTVAACCVDFTHTTLHSGLSVLLPTGLGKSSESALLRTVVSPDMVNSLSLIIVAWFGAALVIWLLERGSNSQQFSHSLPEGVADAVYWAGVTSTTVGFGDKAPQTKAGRFFALVWMVVSLLGVSVITALFSASLTEHKLQAGLNGLDEMAGLTVCTHEVYRDTLLRIARVEVVVMDSMADCLAAVDSGGAVGYFMDAPILWHFLVGGGGGGKYLVSGFERRLELGWAVAEGSPLLRQLNPEILRVLELPAYDSLVVRWFDNADTDPSAVDSDGSSNLLLVALAAALVATLLLWSCCKHWVRACQARRRHRARLKAWRADGGPSPGSATRSHMALRSPVPATMEGEPSLTGAPALTVPLSLQHRTLLVLGEVAAAVKQLQAAAAAPPGNGAPSPRAGAHRREASAATPAASPPRSAGRRAGTPTSSGVTRRRGVLS